jgi:hypothetical protein
LKRLPDRLSADEELTAIHRANLDLALPPGFIDLSLDLLCDG